MEYDIVYADYRDKLIEKVTERIEVGWEPLGGVSAVDDGTRFYQALIRRTPLVVTPTMPPTMLYGAAPAREEANQ